MIVLENGDLQVVVDPENGGKIRSLRSRRTGRQYLYQDPRESFRAGPAYGSHEISGFDECFPTVWPSTYPDGKRRGLDLGDHGLLWQQAWHSEAAGNRVAMRCDVPQLKCEFKRTCRIDPGNCLTLDYEITNHDEQPLKYIYSAHPLLAAGPDTELELPDDMDEVYVFFVANVTGISERSWVAWPPPNADNLRAPYSADRRSCFKAFSGPLESGRASVRHARCRERLQFDFDPQELPHLGFLISQGFDEDVGGPFADQVFLALEPTTGVGDDLPTCEQTGTLAQLAGGQTKSFSISLTLVAD